MTVWPVSGPAVAAGLRPGRSHDRPRVSALRRVAALIVVALLCAAATRQGASDQPALSRPHLAPPGERADMIVADDGSGNFRTIQQALDSLGKGNAAHKIILVKNGTYREKLFITASHVSIVGEDRERTEIEYPELRRLWRETHPDDWGAAVVNIGDEVTDLVIANLTVHNTYGSLHGDHDHQFAIRSGGSATRISLLDANVIADGGDTLSLWNTASGMYYHANCYFEGWVDYVCPRGWCYITNSRFFGHNTSASIWHDGSADKHSKLVIRASRFDGVPGCALGRHHREAQFFLVDALFAPAMADRAIYAVNAPDSYRWPGRYYYANCHREGPGGDSAWFGDNLDKAEERPRAEDITAAWTFGGRWDPENGLPAVLPGAAIPQPADGARTGDPVRPVLRWIPGRNATGHRVFLGRGGPASFREELTDNRFVPGPLDSGAEYCWRVDELTPSGIVIGPTWRFTTAAGVESREAIAWPRCLEQPAGWYRGREAERIADNVLLHQRKTGGWPKNIEMARPIGPDERARLAAEKSEADSTIDNTATTTEIRFLARVFSSTRQERFRAGALDGLRFLVDAQYPNGGWPQFFPLRADYSRHITFNDDAMVRVMELMREVAAGRPPFGFIDAPMRARAAAALAHAIRVTLAAQIKVNGTLTGWCAQHDEVTLEPRGARSYEHPSLGGRESVGIVRFLMSIQRPRPEVVRAIDAAVAWFRASAIKGWRVEERRDASLPRGFDVVMVADPAAPPLWARFYDIATSRPIYSGRDGIIKASLAEVEYERRTGYSWIGPYAADLLDKDYPAWRKRLGR